MELRSYEVMGRDAPVMELSSYEVMESGDGVMKSGDGVMKL